MTSYRQRSDGTKSPINAWSGDFTKAANGLSAKTKQPVVVFTTKPAPAYATAADVALATFFV